jgi:nucleotide-binding universal stress UspA family protein
LPTQEAMMAKRILVPVDLKSCPEALLGLVNDAARGAGATVRLLHVAPMPETIVTDDRVLAYSDQEEARMRVEALDALRAYEVLVAAADVDSVVRFGDAAQEIFREVDEFGADLIAMPAAHRPSVCPRLFGGVAEKVARRAPVAVLLLRAAA